MELLNAPSLPWQLRGNGKELLDFRMTLGSDTYARYSTKEWVSPTPTARFISKTAPTEPKALTGL